MEFPNRLNFWHNRVIDSVGSSLSSRLEFWLTHHPLIHWLFDHALISLLLGFICLIVTVRLFLTIYRTLASAIDQMWLAILRSPFLLLKLLFGWDFKSRKNISSMEITNYEVTHNPQQLEEILNRLEQIQQQQQQIAIDLALLKQKVSSTKPVEIELSSQQHKLPSIGNN
ncbi:MAG: hypothetical protein AAGE96_02515 [Cyanobacteria bacterium P01_G01_bin.19]